ncbi:calcium-binding protein, partial [Phenylobacterium sp.]|uniref:calcium-binding protein n=1 Tax=Phenylobacterium sp. TaxID=1871053 RepID=UPI002734F81F
QTTSYDKAPAILLLEGAAGITVDGNIAYSIADKNFSSTGNIITADNTYAQKLDATKPGYYDSTLINQILALDDADAIYNIAILDLSDSTATNPSIPTDQVTPAPTTSSLIVGTSMADTLSGSAGDDTFDSRGGADLLTGGLGNDTYIVNNTLAKIVEQLSGGTDTVVAKGNYVLGANIENLYVSETATNGWSAKGNGLNNVVVGNAGANVLDGQGGADSLSGRVGNDVLIGGTGADQLTGGAGVDRFTFAKGSGKDVVTDFGDGHDVIDISAFLSAGYKATVVDTGPDTVISFTTGDTITLVGVDKYELITTTGGFTI